MATYTIIDIHEAANQEQAGYRARLEKQLTGRVHFCFDDPDARFFAVLENFHRNAQLQLFVSHLKRLRGRMLDARDARNGNGYGCGEINGNRK